MILISSTTITKAAAINSIAKFGILRRVRMISRLFDCPIQVNPNPRPIARLMHGFPFSTIPKNVADGQKEQERNHRSDDQQNFQSFFLKLGSYQNV